MFKISAFNRVVLILFFCGIFSFRPIYGMENEERNLIKSNNTVKKLIPSKEEPVSLEIKLRAIHHFKKLFLKYGVDLSSQLLSDSLCYDRLKVTANNGDKEAKFL
jgi:hypothetical protein